jgi:TetR/AcrR family transcriptional regulator, lmrAB and yxaGH operons repressor
MLAPDSRSDAVRAPREPREARAPRAVREVRPDAPRPLRGSREKIVRAAARLFRRFGYSATGTNDIVAASGAPKGSLYHYFPGGKEQIAIEAIAYAGGLASKTLTQLCEQTADPAEAIRQYGKLLAGWMAQSDYRDGCPIATILLELAPATPNVTQAGRAVLDSWVGIIAVALQRSGVARRAAHRLASAAISGLEGSLLLARVTGDSKPIIDLAAVMAQVFRTAIEGAHGR